MSRYWCIDDASGKTLADGLAGEWPLTEEAVAKVPPDDHDFDDNYRRFRLACDIYATLRRMRPHGGEVPWSEVPDDIKVMTIIEGTPVKACVSF